MVRPKKINRSTIALTTIRVQPNVLRLLNQLKIKYGFKDHNSTIKYYLPPNIWRDRPTHRYHTAAELRLLNGRPSDEEILALPPKKKKKTGLVG